jgi:predicted Zn-dependent protease
VEEGNVLSWMYPYLEPHGLIMRLQPQPVLVVDPSVIGRDRRYWDEQARRLLADVRFQRDPIARLVYSRARAAIAGLYAHHRMADDAEYAYRQALELYPDNQEAVRRLAQLLVQLDRYDDALRLLNDTLRRDSYNVPLREAVNQIQEFQKAAAATEELEAQRAAQPGDFSVALQLLASYARRQRLEKMEALTNELLAQPSLSAANFLQMADIYAGMRQWNAVAQLLQYCVQHYPNEADAWYQLAVANSARGNCYECVTAITRALALDPSGRLRAAARQDDLLEPCRRDPMFQQTLGAL